MFAVLISVMAGSFGVMYVLAGVSTADVAEGAAAVGFPQAVPSLYLGFAVLAVARANWALGVACAMAGACSQPA